ncbi:MAG: glycerophosphodiester phosphodiesterase [Deltaproteobacteria bacterium]|nr:glycerophosphodiester phosphodiesterase [Deltaproteobacteria bacterium]
MANPFARLVPHLGRLGRATRWRRVGGRPRVFAHRGDSAHAPENTMRAFELAKAVGADGIELDVRFDGDKNVVVFHDASLDRLAGRPGELAATSAAERAKLRIGGEPIPLLAEVLATVDMELDIEIKTRAGRGAELAAATARLVRDSHRADQVLVSSFDPLALVQFHRHLPEVALGFLFHDKQSRPFRRGWIGRWIGASCIHPQHTLVDADSVRRWHGAGMPVNVWTVDDAEELRRLDDLGIDSVCANDPAHALAVFDAPRAP